MILSGNPRTSSSNTTIPRTQKRSTKRKLSQLATWVEDPIVFKIQQKARKKGVSTSAAIRRLLINALKDEESIDEALDTEALREAIARDNRRLAARLSWFLVRILYDVGHIKGLATNTLGMQQSMTQELLKDIVQDAHRQTEASLSRQNPELAGFMDEVETWLLAHEEGETSPRQTARQGQGRGGARV